MNDITPETLAVLNAIAEDRDAIPYRKRLNKITDSVTASILLQQILYWSQKEGFKPFYKFRAPCKHKLYKPGDSWVEEIGFSLAEFDTAIKKIGTKITKGINKRAAYQGTTPQHLVIYWTDSSRISWYHLNVNLLGKFIMSIYLENQETEFTSKSEKPDLPLTETTIKNQETTTIDSLPLGIDGQQRAVDVANGANGPDPRGEVAKHICWLCLGQGVPLPKGKARSPYMKAGKALLEKTDAKDWKGVCYAVDHWSEDPPQADVWRRERTKEPMFAIDHLAAHYWHLRNKPKPELAEPVVIEPKKPDTPNEADWKAVQAVLQGKMTEATYLTRVHKDKTKLIDRDNGTWVIGCSSIEAQDWLTNRLRAVILGAIQAAGHDDVEAVRFEIVEDSR